MSLKSNDLKILTRDLPPIAVLSDFPYGPVDRVSQCLIEAGATLKIINLTTSIKAQSEYNQLSGFREVIGDANKNFQKLKVYQALFERKHPKLNKIYDTFFSNFDLGIDLKGSKTISDAQIFILGNIFGLYPYSNISDIAKNKYIINRISTSQSVTGYCIFTAGCQKWQISGCSKCPQLGLATTGKDECQTSFNKKSNEFQKLKNRIFFVTPSKWLQQEVQKSILARHHCCLNIPTSVNLDIFKPYDKDTSKKNLGIKTHSPLILIGSAGLRRNKGLHVLCKALSLLSHKWKKRPTLIFFGYAPSDTSLLDTIGIPWQSLGWIGNPKILAQVYSAADIFVSPSFQDNLPNTVNEALSCGTPVICFDKFSSEDVVIDGITGLLAKHPGLPLASDGTSKHGSPYDVDTMQCTDLAKKIFMLLNCSSSEKKILQQNCRIFAERFFPAPLQALRYTNLCRKILTLPEKISCAPYEDQSFFTNGLTKVVF